jgi:Ni/Co efflux regulator RcnB
LRNFTVERNFCWERKQMKRFIFVLIMMSLFAGMLIFASPESVQAQTYQRRVVRNGRVHWVRTRKPSFYRRHRNRTNMAIGTGAGALIGGVVGGPKGALIGAGAGLGGSALYTYKLNKKKRVYRKVRHY